MSGRDEGGGVTGGEPQTGSKAATRHRGLAGFLRATFVGGIAFLLPFGLVIIVFNRLIQMVRPTGDAIRTLLLPASAAEPGATIFTILLLVVSAFAAGLFMRSSAGRGVFDWLERTVLMNIPPYRLFSRMIHDEADGPGILPAGAEDEVVVVRLDDQTLIGFLVERLPDGRGVVYLPGAPSAFTGSVAIIDADRITATTLSAADVMGRMRQLGAGLHTSLGPA